MLIAKLTAVLGLALLVGGSTDALAATSLGIGAVLLLVAATIGAVVMEGRDLEVAAGLAPHRADETEAEVLSLVVPTSPVEGAAARSAA